MKAITAMRPEYLAAIVIAGIRPTANPVWVFHLSLSPCGPAGVAAMAQNIVAGWVEIRQPHVVRPVVGIHRHAVAATVVGAVDQDATHAHIVAHLAEGDFLGSRCEHYFDSALAGPVSTIMQAEVVPRAALTHIGDSCAS
jgi:hypothetical protein